VGAVGAGAADVKAARARTKRGWRKLGMVNMLVGGGFDKLYFSLMVKDIPLVWGQLRNLMSWGCVDEQVGRGGFGSDRQ
jgi:hypothetical protein